MSIICFVACKNDAQKLADVMKKVIGQQIEIPAYSEAKILGATIPFPDSLLKKNKVIVYTPPLLCTSCNLDCLEEWKIFMEELKDYPDIHFIFIFKPRKEKELTNTLKEFNFNYPVIYDKTNTYIKKNKMLNHPIFYTLLVDHTNKIIMAGNPVGNETLWNLYKQQIRQLSIIQTTPYKRIVSGEGVGEMI